MNRGYFFFLPLVLLLALMWAAIPMAKDSASVALRPQTQTVQNDKGNNGAALGEDDAEAVSAEDIRQAPPDLDGGSDGAKAYMIAQEHEGYLCLFKPDNMDEPAIRLDVPMSSLTPADRAALREGFALYSEIDVVKFIEDYSS